jgi:hypothetical protein
MKAFSKGAVTPHFRPKARHSPRESEVNHLNLGHVGLLLDHLPSEYKAKVIIIQK